MPKPHSGEKQKDFISRCIPYLIKEGKSQEQAAGACYGIWKNKMEEMQQTDNSIINFLFPTAKPIINPNPNGNIDTVNLKDKTIMVVDHGIFTYLAEKLVPYFKKVYYFCHYQEEFQTLHQISIGLGLPGVINVHDIFEVDDVDLYIFPNTYDSILQTQLLKMGKNVFGGRKGDELELNRWYGLQKLQEIGLPVPNLTRIIGLNSLIEFLKTVENKYIKISGLRGIGETWHFSNYQECEQYLNVELRENCGGLENYIEFLIFDPIGDKNSIETGMDSICIDGQFSDMVSYGYEIKDACYVCKYVKYEQLPQIIKNSTDKLQNTLKEYGYRNFFSDELRIANTVPYLIDFTCRLGSPSGELLIENIENIAEVIWYGAQGQSIPLKMKYVYGVQAHIKSCFVQENWQTVFIDESVKPFVKLRNYCIVDGKYYVIPNPMGYDEVGTILGFGNTLEEAIIHLQNNAEKVSGFQIEIELDAIEKGINQIKEGLKIGINF